MSQAKVTDKVISFFPIPCQLEDISDCCSFASLLRTMEEQGSG